MRKFSQPQNPNPMDLRVQRRHKKREGKVERETARVFYKRLSQVRLKIQSINFISVFGVKPPHWAPAAGDGFLRPGALNELALGLWAGQTKLKYSSDSGRGRLFQSSKI